MTPQTRTSCWRRSRVVTCGRWRRCTAGCGCRCVKGTRWQSGSPRVRGHDLHAPQPPGGGGPGGMRRVRVQGDDPACRCDLPGQQVHDAARAAAQIDLRPVLAAGQPGPAGPGCRRLARQPDAAAGRSRPGCWPARRRRSGPDPVSCPKPAGRIRPCCTTSRPGSLGNTPHQVPGVTTGGAAMRVPNRRRSGYKLPRNRRLRRHARRQPAHRYPYADQCQARTRTPRTRGASPDHARRMSGPDAPAPGN